MYPQSMYICATCEYSTSTKLGKCPSCNQFGTIIKDPTKVKHKKSKKKYEGSTGVILEEETKVSSRRSLTHKEFKRIFPQGIKEGASYLLGGEPGIGKSTMVLHLIAELLKGQGLTLGYFSGEEQTSQIRERRLRLFPNQSLPESVSFFHVSDIEDICSTATSLKCDLIIVDSIQTVHSKQLDGLSGSTNQVKYCCEILTKRSHTKGVSSLILGHVTKGGDLAGPKYLEHIVDVVLSLDGDRDQQIRFLRALKNRFGSTDEVGIFEMTKQGLQAVSDIEERMMKRRPKNTPGNILGIGIDNGRPVLVVVEALLNKSYDKYPQKICQGISISRLNIILAVLENYLKVRLGEYNIYVNIPGQFTFKDSGLDLAVATAILSHIKQRTIPSNIVCIGEIGLGGQILPTKFHKKRMQQATGYEIIDSEGCQHISGLPGLIL